MQKKIIIDTSVYIDIFNSGLRKNLKNPFRYVVMLAPPVLHELWMGARGEKEVSHLVAFQNEFVRLKRLILPTTSTVMLIGQSCRRLRKSGKLDPVHPRSYNDITIAAMARQAGAVVITKNTRDFKIIQDVIDFAFEDGKTIE